jgi:hypothetical protein
MDGFQSTPERPIPYPDDQIPPHMRDQVAVTRACVELAIGSACLVAQETPELGTLILTLIIRNLTSVSQQNTDIVQVMGTVRRRLRREQGGGGSGRFA